MLQSEIELMEIEKKFKLMRPVPVGILCKAISVKQGYLIAGSVELRLRKIGDDYFITIKGDGTISRNEWETETPSWVFDALWSHTEGRRLQKTRYFAEHDGLTLEIDEYHDALAGLWTLECEFATQAEANSFVLPAWAATAVDITEDKRYKNKNLAADGIPK